MTGMAKDREVGKVTGFFVNPGGEDSGPPNSAARAFRLSPTPTTWMAHSLNIKWFARRQAEEVGWASAALPASTRF